MSDSDADSRDVRRQQIRKLQTGKGKGRTGGFGQLYDQRFRAPFEESLQLAMRRCEPPHGNIVGEATTRLIVDDLRHVVKRAFKGLLQNEDKESKMQWSSVGDKYVFGNHPRRTIPHITTSIYALEDERWESFWIQRLIVKHNHFVAAKQHEKGKVRGSLVDIPGKLSATMFLKSHMIQNF